MGTRCPGKGLFYSKVLQQVNERMGHILRSTVTMEHGLCLWLPICVGLFKSLGKQLGAAFVRDSIGNHFPRKQVYDDAEIIILVTEFKNSDIADPDLIRPFGLKLLLQEISVLSLLPSFIFLLCHSADAADSQLLHKLGNILFVGFDPLILENSGDLARSIDLSAIIINALNLRFQLRPPLSRKCVTFLIAENMVVESAT